MSLFQRLSRRHALLAVLAAALVASATAAFAYWTSAGEGTGQVSASSGGAGFEVTSSLASGLYPSANVAVAVKVKNKDSSQPERLSRLEVEVEKTSKESEPEPCKKSWFVATPGSQEPAVVIGPSESKEYTAHLEMKEESENQNGCKGATVTLKYKAS